MNKIAIITDSVACLNKEQQEKYQIEIVPVNVRFEGKVYRDWIDLSPTQAYEFMEKNPDDYATSAPSPGDFLAAYKKKAQEGKKEILCLTLSQKLSATWNSARIAKELASSELPDVRIEVVNTNTGAGGQALLCLTAARAAEEGKNLDEIVKLIEDLKGKTRVFLLLETIRYIYRSGRVPEAASKIGALLPLKPILKLSEGTIHVAGAAISRQKGIDKLLEILQNDWDQNMSEIALTHSGDLPETEKVKERIVSQFPAAKIFISELSPVLGYFAGRGVLSISFFAK